MWFVACPYELRCVSVDPRPAPSQGELNQELVDGLEDCGYLKDGRLGTVSMVRVNANTDEQLSSCARACALELSNDCEQLYRVACDSAVPEGLSRCLQKCSCGHGPSGHIPHAHCMQGAALRCGLNSDLADDGSAAHHTNFRCLDGSKTVAQSQLCNLVHDCADGSDEAPSLGCARLLCDEAP